MLLCVTVKRRNSVPCFAWTTVFKEQLYRRTFDKSRSHQHFVNTWNIWPVYWVFMNSTLIEVQQGSALIAVFRYTRQNNLWFIHETAMCCHGDVLASTFFTETFLLCLFQRVHRSRHRLLSCGCTELQSYGWGKHVIMAVVWGRNVYVVEKVEREGGF